MGSHPVDLAIVVVVVQDAGRASLAGRYLISAMADSDQLIPQLCRRTFLSVRILSCSPPRQILILSLTDQRIYAPVACKI